MGKKQAYYATAEKLYIEDRIPLSGISSRLGITEKTLRDWKKEGDWEKKKIQLLKIQNSCNVELHKLVMNLTQKVNDDIASGVAPDAGTLYTIKSLASTLPKLKSYEDSILQEESKSKEESSSADEIISKVNDILGIR